jgi:outer membrane lipoprotein-sorting protein
MSLRGWLLVVVAGALAVSGCLAMPSEDPSAAAVLDDVEGNLEETEAFEGRLVQAQHIDGETTRMEAIVAYEEPGKLNVTYVSPERFAGTRIVSNGSATMIYNPHTGTATVGPVESTAGHNATASGLFFGITSVGDEAAIENTETGDGDTLSLSYAVDGQQVSLFVGGSADSRSRLTNTSSPVETTVWIDRDRQLPTKARLNYTNTRVPMVQTIEYRNLTVVDDLPDERFSTDPPADARRSEGQLTPFMDENMTSYLSRSAMVDAVDQPVPDPDLPDRFAFQQGMTLGDGALVWEIYGDDGDIVQIQRLPEPVSVYESDRTVTVHGEEATLTRLQGQHVIEWQCGGSTFALYGTASAFDPAELADIGGSIDCR